MHLQPPPTLTVLVDVTVAAGGDDVITAAEFFPETVVEMTEVLVWTGAVTVAVNELMLVVFTTAGMPKAKVIVVEVRMT